MSNVITCAAAVEPDAFFDHATHAAIFATLNFNVTTGSEAAARLQFQTFLTDLPAARFYLYRATRTQTGTFDLDLEGPGQPLATIPAAPPLGLAAEIFTWLDDRAKAPVAAKWVFDPAAQPGERDYRRVAATHLLDSAERWDAPLPQRAGLSRLLECDKPNAGSEYLVVPCVGATVGAGGMPARISDVPLDGDCYVIPPASIPNLAAEIRTTPIAQPAALALIDEDSGFLAVTTDANGIPDTVELDDLLSRVRERAGARLAVAPQMLDIAWPGAAPDWKGLLKRLRWRGLNALLVMLDPIVVVLTMTGPAQEGPLVMTLNAAIGDLLHEKGREFSAADAARVKAWVKLKVNECLRTDVTNGASRLQFVNNVASLFGFTDQLSLSTVANGRALKDVPKLLPLLLSLFEQFGTGDGPLASGPFEDARKDKGWLEDLEKQVDRELAEALQRLEGEEGVERALLETMRLAGIDAAGLVGALPAGTIARDEAQTVFTGLQRQIRGSRFNGSEAARNVQGLLFEAALIAEPDPQPGQTRHRATPAELKQKLEAANWFAVRLNLGRGGAQPSVFEPIAAGLPLVDLPLDSSDVAGLLEPTNNNSLVARYDDADADLSERPVTMGRVVPDQIPRPLPIQISVDQNEKDAVQFSIAYNGVGLLVRRDQESWAHANLAMLQLRASTLRQGPTLHPVLTQANDGHSRVTIDYNGDPLARTKGAPAFEERGDAEGLEGFYTHDDPDDGEFGAFSKLPALGYGHVYSVASFVTSKSGALPRSVAAATVPWVPKEAPEVPVGSFVARYPYWRTTAIGQVSLGDAAGEAPDDGSARFAPFNSAIEGVTPLFRDYPRIGHAAAPANNMVLDIWRDRDGHGIVPLPSDDKTVSWPLQELSWSGGVQAFNIELMGSDNAGDPALAAWPITVTGEQFRGDIGFDLTRLDAHRLECALDLGATSAHTATPTVVVQLNAADVRLWLRCSMTVGQNGGGMSLPDPRAEAGAAPNATPGSGGFLLLAPDKPDYWKSGIATAAKLSLSFPRMSFLDFDRWLNGKRLFEEAADAHGLVKTFWEGLHTLMHDPALDPKTAALLGQLPDLAVTALLLDLIPIDALDGATPQPISKKIPIRPLKDLLQGSDTRANLSRMIADRQKIFTVVSGNSLEIDVTAGKISVPSGMVAQLRVRPLVPRRYTDAGALRAFDDNVPRWAVGQYVEAGEPFLIFDGPVLTVETMRELLPSAKVDLWASLADEMLQLQPFGKERRYDLTLVRPSMAGFERWRQLSSVDVGTQRWRFLGRPVISQLNGSQLGTNPVVDPGCPVRELSRMVDAAVDAFEGEIFGSFDMEDADTQNVTLRPQAKNVLQSFHWEAPSATMFRHRVVLRSRYAGAIRRANDAEVTVTWNPATKAGLHLRVAILADRTRLQLTRPQMRALMPLPASVDADATTPAVLAMLEERPLDYGGLAERIGAEIKTSLGYDLQGNGPVKAIDARKEFGPDPHISYMPTPEANAAGVVLETEGPIGLTFDTAASPTWANSALILQPNLLQTTSVTAASFEEHFLSVSMRRYLDPVWTVVEDRQFDANSLPVMEPWWCEVDLTAHESIFSWPDPATPIATVTKNGQWVVSFNTKFLHPDSTAMVELARVDTIAGSRIALMHQPLEGERNAFSVFLQRERNYPVMLASVEWSLTKYQPGPPGPARPVPTFQITPTPKYIAPVSASTGTAMYWARTAINADRLRLKSPTDDTLETIDVTELSVRQLPMAQNSEWAIVRGDILEKRWVRSEKSTHASPLAAHRHLATLVTHSTKTISRTLEQFDKARLLVSNTLQPFDVVADQKVRVVEFEVPARVIASGSNYIPNEYLSARFDLKAILGDRIKKSPPAMLLFIRPLAGALELGPVQALKLKIRGAFAEGNNLKESDIALSSVGLVRATMIILSLDLAGGKYLASAIDPSGVSHDLAPGTLPANWDGLEMLALARYEPSKDQLPLPGEHWADISLLTYPTTSTPPARLDVAAIPLSFDWFFTNDVETAQVDSRGNLLAMTANESVSTSSLRAMREAQARIISVSPPMAVK